MGKRQIRIFRKDIVLKKAEILNKIGHVILADHVVLTGRVLEISEDSLVLENFRFNNHLLNLNQVLEIVYDIETEY